LVAVLKPKVRVPVTTAPVVMSAGTEKAAIVTAETAPAASAGSTAMVGAAVSTIAPALEVQTVYIPAAWELPTVYVPKVRIRVTAPAVRDVENEHVKYWKALTAGVTTPHCETEAHTFAVKAPGVQVPVGPATAAPIVEVYAPEELVR